MPKSLQLFIKMKKKFSRKWKESKQPRKQRKYRANAPLHIKRKMLTVNLSKDLRKKYGKRNISIRKGDIAKVSRGKFKKKQGKVLRIETKDSRVYLEGIQIKKMDGSKVDVPVKPSNVQIIELNLEDRKRGLGKGVKKDREVKENVPKETKSPK